MPTINVNVIAKTDRNKIKVKISNGAKSIDRTISGVSTPQELAEWLMNQKFNSGDLSTAISKSLEITYHTEIVEGEEIKIIDSVSVSDLPAFLRIDKDTALTQIDNIASLAQAKTALTELVKAVYFLKSLI